MRGCVTAGRCRPRLRPSDSLLFPSARPALFFPFRGGRGKRNISPPPLLPSHSGFCSFFLVQGLTFGSAGCQVANPPRPSPAPRHKGGEDASGCAVPRFCRLLWGGLLLFPGFAVRHRRASGTSIRQNPSFAPRHGVFGSFRPFGVFVLFFASPVCVIPPLCGYLCSAVS